MVKIFRVLIVVFLFTFLLYSSGCTLFSPIEIIIIPSSKNMLIGDECGFTAIGKYPFGENKEVATAEWSLSSPKGTLSNTIGSSIIFEATSSGDTILTAKSGGKSGTATILITAPTPGETTMTTTADIQIPDLDTVIDKLHFDSNPNIPDGAIITEAYFEAIIYHTYMRDLHIDVAHGSMIWTEFDPSTNTNPQIFSCYIPEWIGRLAKTDVVLWVTDELEFDTGYVDYWFVTLKWQLP